MATVASNLMTADAFYAFVHRPENRDRPFELERGEIVEMSRPGKRQGFVCGNVTGILWGFVCQHAVFEEAEGLTGDEALPEFRCPVRDFFKMP